jgi:hypothetical protein
MTWYVLERDDTMGTDEVRITKLRGGSGFYSRADHPRIVWVPSTIIDAFDGRSSMMAEGEIEGDKITLRNAQAPDDGIFDRLLRH